MGRLVVACFGLVALGVLAACPYPFYPRRPIYDDAQDAEPGDGAQDAHAHAPPDAPEGDADGDVAPDAVAPPADVEPPFLLLNECERDRYVDRAAPGASRTVAFGGAMGSTTYSYAPSCIVIAAGQSVRFVGDLLEHPIAPGAGSGLPNAGSPNNPIDRRASGSEATFAFPARGMYPYYCETHELSGMVGVVWVR